MVNGLTTMARETREVAVSTGERAGAGEIVFLPRRGILRV